MKKLKFSIITVSITLSFGLFAEEIGSSLYNEAKKEAVKKPSTSTELRSELRNKETLIGLENKTLEAEINRVQKEIELKKLVHALKNVPAEYLDDPDMYYEKIANENKKVDITSLYPDIREKTRVFDNFPKETFDIDQRTAIPLLEEQTKKIDREPIRNTDVEVISQELLNQNMFNNVIQPEIEPEIIPEIDSEDVDVIKEKEPELDYDIEGELSDTLSEEERKKLAAILNNDNEDIIDTRKGSLEKENEEIEVASVFSEIEKLSIDGIYIFGNNKSADLTLSFYVGDGVEGETYENKFREIKENQIISVKGFKYQIKNITFKEVEIENMQDGELYIASKSLRTIK
tara:strand:+ start:986 stop:2023 length:1038 start_codon:yes stop_codon:yes gene_type:complete